MRSTTITDWDRKELIVPNKQFITQEVVNWSIGDSCIRLVLPVGVSYGDDPETVSGILTEVGRQDPETLADPEPHVAFTGFGDSSLNFELRVFLAGTDGLITVRNRLNTAIKKAFDAAGVSIPFPQRDVHVSMVSRQDPEGGPQAPLPVPPPDSSPAEGSAS
jgi:potassium efflux system protein